LPKPSGILNDTGKIGGHVTWLVILKKIKSIPWEAWALLVTLVVLSYSGWRLYEMGRASVQKKWDASVERGKAEVERLKQQQVVVKTVVETQVVEKIKTVKVKGDEIIKQVPIYIPIDTPDLPSGFRLLHDSAVLQLSPSAGSALGETVPVTDATSTIIGNYTQCYKWREQVIGWQDWYERMQKLQVKESPH
jgi:hypothetical protein